MAHNRYNVTTLLLSLVVPIAAPAYEQVTHRRLATTTVENSVLAAPTSSILADFGLSTDISQESQERFPNSEGKTQSIIQLIEDGADFEDKVSLTLPRPIHHFYDPINNQSLQHPLLNLVGGTKASPDWALEDTGDSNGQDNSYKNATDAFFNALTLPTKTERDQQWGIVFESLGHVIHHIQDMAQPEHVRNDLHCGEFWGCGLPGAFVGIYDPSLFEQRSKTVFRNGISPALVNYPKVAFPTAREFWTTRNSDPVVTSRRGLADFTNRNFISKDTNFEIKNGTPAASSRYSLPEPSGTNIVDLGVLDADGAGICQRLNQKGPVDLPPNSPCQVEFIENVVTDSYDPIKSGINTRAASLSLFDQYLTEYNVDSALVGDGDAFHVMDVDRLVTVNEYNIDAAHPFLIPRAIAYGAGLIDHFFRGKIDMLPNPNGAGWVIKNSSDEDMEGTFTLYYDSSQNVNGQQVTLRASIPGASWPSVIVPSKGEVVVGDYTVPSGLISKTLVFVGRIGVENDVHAAKYFSGWSGPVQITNQGPNDGTALATDAAGNAILLNFIFDQATGTHSLWSRRYEPATGWKSSELLSNFSTGGVRLAIDASGNAIAVYLTYDQAASTESLWSRRYEPATGWSNAELLYSANQSALVSGFAFAMNQSGSAIVMLNVYDRTTAALYNLLSWHYTPEGGWSNAVVIPDAPSGSLSIAISVDIDAMGNAIAVYPYRDLDSGIYGLWSRRYLASTGWENAVFVSPNSSGKVTMDAAGNAIIVYSTFDADTSAMALWAKQYGPVTGWGSAVLLSNSALVPSYNNLLAMDAAGNAIVIYGYYDTVLGSNSLRTRRYEPATGWSSAESLSYSYSRIGNGSLAMDSAGNAIVMYVSSNTATPMVKHYVPGVGWGEEIALSGNSEIPSQSPIITMGAGGTATAIWLEYAGAGAFQLWSNHYIP